MSPSTDQVIQRFVSEGNFVVMPLAFPSVCEPILPDESRVTALVYTENKATRNGKSTFTGVTPAAVYGLTSGRRAHLFLAAAKARGGYVVDLGAVPEMTDGVAVAVHEESVIASLNGPGGGRIVKTPLMYTSCGVQEWGFCRGDIVTLVDFPGERLLDTVFLAVREELLCLTDRRLVRVRLATREEPTKWRGYFLRIIEVREVLTLDDGEVSAPAITSLGRLPDDSVCMTLRGPEILRLAAGGDRPESTGLSLATDAGWGWCAVPDGLLCADATGLVCELRPDEGLLRPLDRVLVPPVKCIACVTPERAYAFYGDEIGRFGRIDLPTGATTDLGAVLAVLGAKRYANTLCCGVVGPDGEVYFGEDDRGGCLWLYFPPLSV